MKRKVLRRITVLTLHPHNITSYDNMIVILVSVTRR